MSYLEQLKRICRQNPQTVVFAEANHASVIKAARFLFDEGLAWPVLLGGAFEVRDLAEKLKVSTRGIKIVNPNHALETGPFLGKLLLRDKNLKRVEAAKFIQDPIIQTIFRLKGGQADLAFAGNNSSVANVVSKGLKWSGVHTAFRRVSSFYVMVSPDTKNIFSFADCSINVVPNPRELAEIALKTASNFKLVTNRQPRIAFLSFSTKGSATHTNVENIKEAVHIFNNQNSSFDFDGELQFDAAIDQLIAQKKAPASSLNGNANVFIFPSLNAANIAQKLAVELAGYTAIGPMVQGLNNPLHSLAKSCSVTDVINSVLLASIIKIKNK